MIDLAQLKLTSGNEILCEVVEWPDSDGNDLIIKNVMTIESVEFESEKVYMFRPWIHYLESDNEYTVVNIDHVISINKPNKHLVKQYKYAVKEMHASSAHRDKEYEAYEKERMKKFMEITGLSRNNDSDSQRAANIISFPKPDDTIH